jgi:hypothetical protein
VVIFELFVRSVWNNAMGRRIEMRQRVLCLTLATILFVSLPAQACTLWAANGSIVKGGGSLIVKNRDWAPEQREFLKFVSNGSGYKYFGLCADGKYPGIKAGINEKGLVVVSATVASIPSKERRALPHKRGVLVKLLRECDCVDQALSRTDLFLGPEILMIADKHKVATIEIGPEGKYSVSVKDNDSVYHTNHYVNDGMLEFNKKVDESSQTRFNRIRQLLYDAIKPYDLDTFIAFSTDQNDGPDNSIFRTGSTSIKTRTMAVWAVEIPQVSSPEIYVKILNRNENEQILRIAADDVFNGKIVLSD